MSTGLRVEETPAERGLTQSLHGVVAAVDARTDRHADVDVHGDPDAGALEASWSRCLGHFEQLTGSGRQAREVPTQGDYSCCSPIRRRRRIRSTTVCFLRGGRRAAWSRAGGAMHELVIDRVR